MFWTQQSERIADSPDQTSGRKVRECHELWSSCPYRPLPWLLNDKFPTSVLAISEAKPLKEQQQNNDGWEFTVPKPEVQQLVDQAFEGEPMKPRKAAHLDQRKSGKLWRVLRWGTKRVITCLQDKICYWQCVLFIPIDSFIVTDFLNSMALTDPHRIPFL